MTTAPRLVTALTIWHAWMEDSDWWDGNALYLDLDTSGRPWVIENVPEVPLRPDYLLCGSQFGINVRRHRSFETSWGGGGELLPPCWHHKGLLPFMHKGERAYADAMGCTWMNKTEARQAVPPAYTEWIGRQFLAGQLDQAA